MKAFVLTLLLCLTAIRSMAQQTQTIRGRIIDEASKAPLVGASVLVMIQGAEKPLGSVTNLEGEFKISNVPIGRQTLRITYIGYETITQPNIIVTAGKEVILNLAMTESLAQVEEVVITYDRKQNKSETINEMSTVSARSFNVDDTKRYAGALGDPSRMAANFAGVVSGNDSRNDIVVRGNSPTGMLWQLEGINIPNPNHFGAMNSTGGPVSILNNNVLDKSDFFTSAFPANYGNATAGAFDLRLRNGNNEKREYVGQVGFNGFELGAEGPFSSKSKGSYLINYRYSTLGAFQALGINFGTGSATPNYQDINAKINLPIGNKGKLTLFALGGKSDVKFLGNDADTTQANFYANENANVIVDYQTGIAGISYEHQLSNKTSAKITLGTSATRENFQGDSISVETRQEFIEGKATFNTNKHSVVANIQHKLNKKNTIQAGATVDWLFFELQNKDYSHGGTREYTRVNISDQSVLTQAYTQWKHRFSERLTLNSGLHFQHYTLGNASAIEPRIGLKYFLGNTQSLSLGYGLHSQTQSVYNYFVETPTEAGMVRTNKNLGFTQNHHFVLGYDRNLNENTIIKAEAYYQSIFNAPVTIRPTSFSGLNVGADFAPSDEDSLQNAGIGRNLGVELTLERYFSQGIYYLVTASVFDSKYQGSDKIWRNTAFNTNYVLNVLAGKEFKVGASKTNVFAVAIRLSTVGGRNLTPILYDESARQGRPVYDDSRAFSEKQTAYFRTDIKLSYRKEYSKSTLEFALDLQNLTNHKNVFQRTYNRRTNQLVTEYQQGFFPVPFVRYTF